MLIKRMSQIAFDQLKLGKIRIGTLYQYKRTEDSARRDRNEGPPPIHVLGGSEDAPRVIDGEEFNRLAGSVGAPYRITGNLKLNLKGKGKMIMETQLNFFVFCTSIEDSITGDLDSKFGTNRIEIVDPDKFSAYISAKLYGELLDRRTLEINPEANCISRLRAPVQYQVKEPANPDQVVDDKYDLGQVFIKDPEEYEEEAEYRFLWFPSTQGETKLYSLPLGLEYFELEVPEIWEFIREVA